MKQEKSSIGNDLHKVFGIRPELLSYDFIAGLIAAEGTFYWTFNKIRKANEPCFALRTHIRDFDLLVNIAYSLCLTEKVYEYRHNSRHYAFLIVRSFDGLRKIIQEIYPRLTGHKLEQFIKWFQMFEYATEPRYRAIYCIFKNKFPELYKARI